MSFQIETGLGRHLESNAGPIEDLAKVAGL